MGDKEVGWPEPLEEPVDPLPNVGTDDGADEARPVEEGTGIAMTDEGGCRWG
jgi:hypothetical protein